MKTILKAKKNHAEKILVLFPFLTRSWKPVTTPAFIFLSLLFLLHVVFFSKTTLIEGWSVFTGMVHNVNLTFHEAGHIDDSCMKPESITDSF